MITKELSTSPAGAGITSGRKNFWPLLIFGIIMAGLAAAPVAAYTQPGTLTVLVSPGDALACVDGNYCRGTVDDGPAFFDGLAVNSYHTLTVEKGGYETSVTSFFSDPSATGLTISVNLQPNPATGRIQAYVSPSGGTFCMDSGQCDSYGPADPSGETSRQWGDLAAYQYHTLTVFMDGFEPYTQDIWVTPGTTSEVHVTMQPWSR